MKYILVVEDIEGKEGDVFQCPLNLDGSESTDFAVERFKDALCVFRNALAVALGSSRTSASRIDGRLSPDALARISEVETRGIIQ